MERHIRDQEWCLPLEKGTEAGWEDTLLTTKYNIHFDF